MKTYLKGVVFTLVILAFSQCTQEGNAVQGDEEEKACCEVETAIKTSETSEITCPECGHTKTEVLPTDVCTIVYTCQNCQAELTPKEGDCCVYCTYGTHKCPSKQAD